MPDLEAVLRKLAALSEANPYERVYAWRQILDEVRREGFEAGYTAGRRDRELSEQIAQQEASRDA
ncbi:hypothetical protein ACLQ2R_17475 [Streptosporangium sp. DT93]|uniref:hypothetical protein n=1 Tax=Streptosporangium sp. DT93 TaxID=3393428 RepID=UPI003CF68457